jgi:hypothetical protein
MSAILTDWDTKLAELVSNYREAHTNAPQFGYKSRLTKQYINSKYQIKMDFLDNLMEMSILCDDDAVTAKIDALIQRYEKQR